MLSFKSTKHLKAYKIRKDQIRFQERIDQKTGLKSFAKEFLIEGSF